MDQTHQTHSGAPDSGAPDAAQTERADHAAAAAAHRAAASSHRERRPDGAGWRSRRAAEWSRTTEAHRPAGGHGPGREAARIAVGHAKTAERWHAQREHATAAVHHEAAAQAHDRAAAEHEAAAAAT